MYTWNYTRLDSIESGRVFYFMIVFITVFMASKCKLYILFDVARNIHQKEFQEVQKWHLMVIVGIS